VGWFAALYVGYRWVWPDGFPLSGNEPSETLDDTAPSSDKAAMPHEARAKPEGTATTPALNATDSEPIPTTQASSIPAELPGCDAFLAEARAGEAERMPAHLGRSALDQFIGSTEWTKPCRGRRRRSIEFCAAVRDGRIVGLTLRAIPKDLSLEDCVREQAQKLTLRSEPSLHIYQAQLSL
jgi:hypothetical protein